jgi:hypothetical protein
VEGVGVEEEEGVALHLDQEGEGAQEAEALLE